MARDISVGTPPVPTVEPRTTLIDRDSFSIADADADNERWTPGYLSGNEGASKDINTTVLGKLMLKLDPDDSPTAARYGLLRVLPIYTPVFQADIDLAVTWGSIDSVTAKMAGILVSKGTSFNSQNYVAIVKQKGTGINCISAIAILNNVLQTQVNFSTTDNKVAFRIERIGKIWNCYYSLGLYPNYNWVLLASFDDPSNFMTGQVVFYPQVYTPGTDDGETVQGDFDNFFLYTTIDTTNLYTTDAAITAIKTQTDKLTEVVTVGSYNHPNDTDPHDALIFAAGLRAIELRFDMSNLAQTTTVGEFEQIDGVNYRELSAKIFPTDFDPGCKVVDLGFRQANALYKITFQSSLGEGGIKAVPYRYIAKDLS